MEKILLEILRRFESCDVLDDRELRSIIRKANKEHGGSGNAFAKRKLMPFYLRAKAAGDGRWESWGITPELEQRLVRTIQMKPRRSASGVATISVITKPWSCGNDCRYCPNDVSMPKSYIGDEPACQRAMQNYFDPYLQVHMRLRALREMGHPIDKVELIVLGGTWCDYPREYQLWFVEQMFAAVNDMGEGDAPVPAASLAAERCKFYQDAGLTIDPDAVHQQQADVQAQVDKGELAFNTAIDKLYRRNPDWQQAAAIQHATIDDVLRQHKRNETSAHRVVGLVVETRPDAVAPQKLEFLRKLGCTKIQMGVQSTRQDILNVNGRRIDVEQIARAFDLARLFGFKIHAHFMVNLLGATPQDDIEDYRGFVQGELFSPDEVKLYPCELVPGTKLVADYESGRWVPYSDDELLEVLVQDVLATPAHIRMSRMIRDIPSIHVLAGNKVTNLRQLVDRAIEQRGLGLQVREIRFREISTGEVDLESLALDTCCYETRATSERFLQWVTPEGKIAGFLRLSLPRRECVEALGEGVPIAPGQAMIREVHVYGRAARLDDGGECGQHAQRTQHAQHAKCAQHAQHAQHAGLGRSLIAAAAKIAREQGYTSLNVISSVGTRQYYRNLGFEDNYLYQQLSLV